jgi:polysaccharide export outer membrane protein
VTISITRSRSQRVTIGGEVRKPGAIDIGPNSTVFDALAEAGGTTDDSSTVVYLMRKDSQGHVARLPISLKDPVIGAGSASTQLVQPGDTIEVPRAERYSILGEVKAPNTYHMEVGLTVMEALARAGGITDRGSTHRIQIVRRDAGGKFVTLKASMTDVIQPNDVIRVRQSIF